LFVSRFLHAFLMSAASRREPHTSDPLGFSLSDGLRSFADVIFILLRESRERRGIRIDEDSAFSGYSSSNSMGVQMIIP